MESQPQPKPKARERILHLLKTCGPQESSELASLLGISAMAVRQHLYTFQDKGWVDFDERARPMGRPAKVWKLTETANQFFPDRHNDLLLNFMETIEKTLGKESLTKLIMHRAENQIVEYSANLESQPGLKEKVDYLAQIRSEEGYMAEVKQDTQGCYLLIENHCPICRAAQSCGDLCDSELKVFRQSLGEEVDVERIEHLMSEDRRCVYRIQSKHSLDQ